MVRFGCGAFFGIFVGIYFLADRLSLLTSSPDNLFYIAAAALICGFLAMVFGDRFWSGLGDFIGMSPLWWLILLSVAASLIYFFFMDP